MRVFIKHFTTFLAVILFGTALTKVMAFFDYPINLLEFDPIFGISVKFLIVFAALAEASLGAFLLFGRGGVIKGFLLICFAVHLGFYRIAWTILEPDRVCPCLGSVPGLIGLSRESLDDFMWLLIGILLAGGILLIAVCGLTKSEAMLNRGGATEFKTV